MENKLLNGHYWAVIKSKGAVCSERASTAECQKALIAAKGLIYLRLSGKVAHRQKPSAL